MFQYLTILKKPFSILKVVFLFRYFSLFHQSTFPHLNHLKLLFSLSLKPTFELLTL